MASNDILHSSNLGATLGQSIANQRNFNYIQAQNDAILAEQRMANNLQAKANWSQYLQSDNGKEFSAWLNKSLPVINKIQKRQNEMDAAFREDKPRIIKELKATPKFTAFDKSLIEFIESPLKGKLRIARFKIFVAPVAIFILMYMYPGVKVLAPWYASFLDSFAGHLTLQAVLTYLVIVPLLLGLLVDGILLLLGKAYYSARLNRTRQEEVYKARQKVINQIGLFDESYLNGDVAQLSWCGTEYNDFAGVVSTNFWNFLNHAYQNFPRPSQFPVVNPPKTGSLSGLAQWSKTYATMKSFSEND